MYYMNEIFFVPFLLWINLLKNVDKTYLLKLIYYGLYLNKVFTFQPVENSDAITTSSSNTEGIQKSSNTQTSTSAPPIPRSASPSIAAQQSPFHALWMYSPIRLLVSVLSSFPSTPSGAAANNEQLLTDINRQPVTSSESTGPSKSALVWIMLLSALFLALLCRRLLFTAT